VNDVVRAALESDDPTAAVGRHQDRINRLDGIKPHTRHIRTMASRAASRHGKPCPKTAMDCNRLQWTAE
jgi:hypothetical protein